METSFLLLKYVCKALIGLVPGGGLAADLLADLLPTVAKDAYQHWSANRDSERMREDLESIAHAQGAEIQAVVKELVAEEAATLSEGERIALEGYLQQIPSAIRRTLRRPSDPTGQTVPTHLLPRNGQDLHRMLPDRLPRFQPGTQPSGCGDWRLERLLGGGGFGEVWLARNPYLPNAAPVALKFCLDAGSARELRNEATLLDRVMKEGRHPGIVELRHTYLGAAIPCLEYEFVEGGELGGLIREWHAGEGRPTAEQAARVILRIASTIAHTHSLVPPIVHRDLKPANILIRGSGDGGQFMIADFGIGGLAAKSAIVATMEGRTHMGEMLGRTLHGSHSPLYASPEQTLGSEPDPRDDIHALGVIWYQLLTGDMGKGRPGGGKWKARLAQERGVPASHLDLLEECFEEDRADRLENAGALVAALERIIDGGLAAARSQPDSPGGASPAPATGQASAPDGGTRGRFARTPPTIWHGENVDVPAFLRRRIRPGQDGKSTV